MADENYPIESKTSYIPKEETLENITGKVSIDQQYEKGKPVRKIIKARIMKHES